MKLLSVVIPTWNRRTLLHEALCSVLACELPEGWDIEVIIADDGSTDGTLNMVEDVARKDGRVRPLALSHCGFPGAVRNRGVEGAMGSIIAFLDSDDMWAPEKLIRQLPLHEHESVMVSHTREVWLRDAHEVSQAGQRHRRSGTIFSDALRKCVIGPSTVMIDTDLYRRSGGFREDLEIAEDYEFWLRLTAVVEVHYIDEPLTVKRAGGWPQLSLKYDHIEGFRIEGLKNLVDIGFFSSRCDTATQHAAVRELARKMRLFARGARKRGRYAEAITLEEEADKYLEME
ncbi:MAG: glycosyltransferase family 2 protein [Spirochaetales bacterium]|nr:glycosyltransferase family 2 protein [Spirochaetales bacterium]